MANRTKFTDRARETFLLALSKTANVREAADAAGISRRTAYDHRDSDEEFRREWDEVINDAVDRLEREAWRRAAEGWEEPVFYQGTEVGRVVKYSDRMLELLLKANRDKYSDKQKLEHSGEGGGPVQFVAPDQYKDPNDWASKQSE